MHKQSISTRSSLSFKGRVTTISHLGFLYTLGAPPNNINTITISSRDSTQSPPPLMPHSNSLANHKIFPRRSIRSTYLIELSRSPFSSKQKRIQSLYPSYTMNSPFKTDILFWYFIPSSLHKHRSILICQNLTSLGAYINCTVLISWIYP